MRRITRALRPASAPRNPRNPRTPHAQQPHLPTRAPHSLCAPCLLRVAFLLRAPYLPRASHFPRALLPVTALCLAALLSACGSDDGRGHAAVGAAGPADGRSPTRPVPPHDGITLTPLDGAGTPAPGNGSPPYASPPPAAPGTANTPDSGPAPPATPRNQARGSGTDRDADHDTASTPGPPPGRPSGHPSQRPSATPPASRPGPNPDPSHTPSPTPKPDTPPHLTTGPVNRTGTDVRWCEKVSVSLHNTGDRPVTSGTITFGTHIIGALGIDWATRTSTHPLPAPLTGHARRTATWRVCVSAWRVPLGMHIETRDVDVDWR